MAFADKYMGALAASNLLDDELHHKAEPLKAAALADRSARNIGAQLHRVKYAGTIAQKLARAIAARERLEKELAKAIREKDERKKIALSQILDSDTAACVMVGGEAAAFRSLYIAWCDIVAKKGAERKWIKPCDMPKIGHLAPAMYMRIATHSLAHYLDDVCKACNGTGAMSFKPILRTCTTCGGTRKAPLADAADLKISSYEHKLVGDMVSELIALEQTHGGAAAAKLRKEG